MAGITPRSFGVAAALLAAMKDGAITAPETPSAPLAILVRGDKWGELIIMRGGQVAFTRSLTGMALSSEPAMLGEIRRNLAVFSGPSALNAPQSLYVAEGELPGGWAGRMRAGLNIPVQAFDPVAGIETSIAPEIRGCFTGPVGLIALRARSPELPINFLAPREPKPISDPNKRLLGLIAVAASLLLFGGLAIGRFVVSEKGDKVAKMQMEKNELDDEIHKLDDSSKRVKGVKDWEEHGINWLDELYDLTARFPDPNSTEVVELTTASIKQAAKSTSKYSAEMRLDLRTKESKQVDELRSFIHWDKHYSIGATESKGNVGSKGSGKNQAFILKMQIEHRDPSAYELQLNAPCARSSH